jgi:hypothetical protein
MVEGRIFTRHAFWRASPATSSKEKPQSVKADWGFSLIMPTFSKYCFQMAGFDTIYMNPEIFDTV